MYSAAVTVGIAAHDITDFHYDRTVPADIYTAGIIGTVAVSAGNDAALDGLCAVGFIQHPQAVIVRSEFMLRIGAAVDDGQLGCEVAIIDIDLISSQVEDVAVKVENYTAAFSDIHYIGNGDIRRKLYSTYSGTGERSFELFSGTYVFD